MKEKCMKTRYWTSSPGLVSFEPTTEKIQKDAFKYIECRLMQHEKFFFVIMSTNNEF